ncbi:cytochrome c oxidase assembly protein [Marinobacterium sp. CAU 1594]|nr:cytochrome c oxidase assembly protein [Marinobacterium arenosum]
MQRKNLRLVRRLILGCLLMFCFGFALVPLYDVFCKVTGLNGKVLNVGPVSIGGQDLARTIKVQLIAVNNEGMPWLFKAQTPQLEVHPGETRKTAYLAHNPTASRMVAQAIPSVAPSEAAQYLHKVNCFCFDQQPLEGFETREMPLLFVVDPELPSHIKTITLSYTLFDITPKSEQHTELIGDRSTTRRIWL